MGTRGATSSWWTTHTLVESWASFRKKSQSLVTMGDNTKQVMGGTAIKPVGWDRTFCESLQYMIYDPANGTILTRTPISWLKIIVFYCIYYSCLAGFWIGCMNIFFLTVPEDRPKWEQGASIIGNNPGVGLRPQSTDRLIDSSMIVLSVGEKDMEPTNPEGEGNKNIDYAVRMRKFMEKYQDTTGMQDCETNEINTGAQSCKFDVDSLGDCRDFPYGYVGNETSNAEPCIFLKFNKICNWEPVPLDPKDEKWRDEMPEELRKKIALAEDKNMVWIDCFGRYAADKEAVKFEYFPEHQGIPVKYFPYKGKSQPYHAPLVAVRVTQHNEDHWGELLHIECRAWYDGVHHDTKEKSGLVQFEVQLVPTDKSLAESLPGYV